MEQRLSWLIFGAGAIGTYLGGGLILHGQKVVFLDQSEVITLIQAQGLKINLHGQEHHILQPDIYSNLAYTLDQASFDVAVFALKSFDTLSALEMIKPFSERMPPILSVQNGVENEAAIEAVMGQGKVIAGSITSAILRRGPGDILVERQRGMGIASDHLLSDNLIHILNESSFNTRSYTSAPAMKWSKMLTNLTTNASSAILDLPPHRILRHPGLYQLEIAQLREALAIMQRLQLQPVDLPGAPVRLFSWAVDHLPVSVSRIFISRIVGHGRGEKMPSFHIDLHSRRGKSEVDYLNGAVVRFGEQLHIPTPVNRWLNLTLQALVNGSLSMGEYAHQPVKFIDHITRYINGENTLVQSMIP